MPENRGVADETEDEADEEDDERRGDKASPFVSGAGREEDEEEGGEREEEAVGAEEGTRAGGFSRWEVLAVPDVGDCGESKGEALGELDAADNGEREETVE